MITLLRCRQEQLRAQPSENPARGSNDRNTGWFPAIKYLLVVWLRSCLREAGEETPSNRTVPANIWRESTGNINGQQCQSHTESWPRILYW
jgi:hypothetical protein